MANINKTSVREEMDRLKAEFQRQCAEKLLSQESRLLLQSVFTLLELILAIFLEKKTAKTNKNSSKPSSQTDKDESALPHKGSKGKGKTEAVQAADNHRITETTSISEVRYCSDCGEDLTSVPCLSHERRTRIDIHFEKVVEHVDAEVKACPTCTHTVKGEFPADMAGPLQYGNGLKAYAINLLVCQMIALNRVQKAVKAMIGQVISEATLLKFILRLHEALADWEQSALEELLQNPSLNVDETSLRVEQKNHWIHVYASGDITLKFLHRSRGKEAIEHIDIIPRYGGVIIHDCWASYLSYTHCGHGLCGSHLLRELTFIVDANGYEWANDMKRLLQATCKTVSVRKRKKLIKKEYAVLQQQYREVIARGEQELPEIPVKPKGQRGKMAKTDAHNLWERLKNYEMAVLLFAKESHVSFTNNRAERDLRMSKVKQKVSGCFRAAHYAQAYCRISSYLQTMANKGYNPLIAIQMALSGRI
ncbi:IS66 family transposase [Microbulbifer sp. SSSA002]|uniref:IS66 family transposase n=1 Tax=Microbulbifer sp. SSSA002 TaxID=3243376 RepID=UPI00403900C5